MSSVTEYSRSLIAPLKAPAGVVETYIEVPFILNESRLYPDGLIRARHGSREWTALVEVKTGKNDLEITQIEHYLEICRREGFNALITISNQIPPVAGQHPLPIDKRKLKSVSLHHWSWSYVLATAVMQKDHRGVSDPDQAWILGELIRYLEHPRSGALELDDMGANWVPVRQSVAAGTLRNTDKSASEVAARFDALMRYTGLRLGQQLGTEVVPVLTRKEISEPAIRAQAHLDSLVTSGILTGAIRIANAVAPITITADLRAGQVTCHLDLEAPKVGRSTTRVNWLVRQLKGAPADLRIEAFAARARGKSSAELLSSVRDEPKVLVADASRELRAFRIALAVPMGAKRGRGRGSFIDSVLDVVDIFYGDIVQHLKAWSAPPPRMRDPDEPPAEPAALTSTALSSQDGTESAMVEPPA